MEGGGKEVKGEKGKSRRQDKKDKATIVARSMLDFYKFNSASYDKVLLKFSRSRMSNCQLAVTPAPPSPVAFLHCILMAWAPEPFVIRCLALEDLPSRFHV